jgi:hypothetical protein
MVSLYAKKRGREKTTLVISKGNFYVSMNIATAAAAATIGVLKG